MPEPLPLPQLRALLDDLDGDASVQPQARKSELLRQHELNRLAAQAILQDAEMRDPGAPLQASEHRRVAAHTTALDLINVALESPSARERREQELADVRLKHPGVFGRSEGRYEREDREQQEIRSFLDRTGPNQLRIPLGAAMRQRERLRNEDTRSLVWDTGNVASAVPTLMAERLYEVLEAEVAMLRLPTTKITTPSGANLDIPRLTTHTLGTQVIAQGTAIGGTDPAFAKTTLGAFKYGALIQVANEVIEDAAVDVLDLIMRDATRAVGRLVDADLVAGSGTGEPLGVMEAITGAGTIATGGSLVDPSYEKLIDLAYSVNDSYRSSGNAAWLMRDATAANIRKLRDGNGGTIGAPLWQSSLVAGIADARQPDLLLGYPAFTDPNVASLASNAKILAFGDWSAYYIRQVHDIVFERDDSFAFDKDVVTFRAKTRVDGDLLDTSAINIMKRSV